MGTADEAPSENRHWTPAVNMGQYLFMKQTALRVERCLIQRPCQGSPIWYKSIKVFYAPSVVVEEKAGRIAVPAARSRLVPWLSLTAETHRVSISGPCRGARCSFTAVRLLSDLRLRDVLKSGLEVSAQILWNLVVDDEVCFLAEGV
jgi:hypothetical protein